jgi:inositol oxygenase
MTKLTNEETAPLASMEEWEEDVLNRYPEPGEPAKAKDEFRNYNRPEIDGVREFYRLNPKRLTS